MSTTPTTPLPDEEREDLARILYEHEAKAAEEYWTRWEILGSEYQRPYHSRADAILAAGFTRTPAPRSTEDDVELDGTDAAHPAWWRGQVDGVRGACMRIEEAIAGQVAGTCCEPLQSLRVRVAALATTRPDGGNNV